MVCIALAALIAGSPRRAQAQTSTIVKAPANASPEPAQAGKASGTDQRSPFAGFSLANSHGPIDIKSDAMELNYKGNSVVFRGNVRANQSGTKLNSNVLTVDYGKDFHDIRQIVADGNVRIEQGGRWATGDHAVLDQVARTVEMTGSPVIHDGPDQIVGTRILIYLDTEKSVVEGAHAVIFPHRSETRDNEPSDEHQMKP